MLEFSVDQIAKLLNAEVRGSASGKITMLAKIQNAQKGQLAFLSNPKYEHYIYSTQATAVIVGKGFTPRKEVAPTLLVVEDPYSSFTALLEEYHRLLTMQKEGVEDPSYVGKNVTVGTAIYRGAFSYIGDNVTIGDHVKIFPHVFIGDNVTIGSHTILHPGAKVHAETRIGQHCVLQSGCVIGSDGFGFAPQADGSYKAIPQLGHVILGDYVEIGANTTIDRATMIGDATTLSEGVKLDNLIQVAHNVEIGKHTVIAAQTGISGSTKVGAFSILAGQVGISGHLVIADRTGIGAQAGISKSITEEGQKIMGSPGFDVHQYFQSYAVYKKLPDLNKRLRELENRISEIANKYLTEST